MCEDFFRKIGRDIKYVILKISSLKYNYKDSYNITIKYGYFYEYSSGLPFYSTLMGIAICFPNLIIHFLNKSKYNREHLNIFFVVLDLIFWVGFSNVLSLYIYIGGYFCYYAGIVILVLYGFISILFHAYLLKNSDKTPSGCIYFWRKLALPLVNQIVNENKSLQPRIKVNVRSFHQESREICEEYNKIDLYRDPEYYWEKEGIDLVKKVRRPYEGTKNVYQRNFYSEWGRVDQGGGKFKEKFQSEDSIFYQMKIEQKEVQT